MGKLLTPKDLIWALNDSRVQLEAILAELDETQLEVAGVAGEWSVKDVLAHLVAWEVDMLTNLGKIRRGIKPGLTDWSDAAVDAQNQVWYREMRDRALDRVLADLEGARRQTLRQVEQLSEADLAATPKGLRQPLGAYIAGQSVEHEVEHLPALQAWLVRTGGALPVEDGDDVDDEPDER